MTLSHLLFVFAGYVPARSIDMTGFRNYILSVGKVSISIVFIACKVMYLSVYLNPDLKFLIEQTRLRQTSSSVINRDVAGRTSLHNS